GAETERADETLTASRLLDLRDGLLGAYRAIAERAPRGCGHGLWQAERALAPVRVAGRDEELRGSAARNPAVTLIVETTGVPGPDDHRGARRNGGRLPRHPVLAAGAHGRRAGAAAGALMRPRPQRARHLGSAL